MEKLDARDAARISSLVVAASNIGLEGARARLDALIEGTLVWSLVAVDRAIAAPQAFGRGSLAALALGLPEGPALVLVDPWLVHVAVDRVLGGQGALALDVAPLSETEAGVFAFIAASILLGSGVQIVAAHRAGTACAAWMQESPCDRWHWRVQAGEHHAYVTLWVSSQVTARSLAELSTRPAHNLPSTLHLRIGRATLKPAEIADLAVGDVLVPDAFSISTSQDGALVGEIDWCSALGQVFVRTNRAAAEDAWLVRAPNDNLLRSHPAHVEASVSSEHRSVELPITLAVTLGQITLTHAEAQAMLPGSLVKTGIPSGGQVHLMAGGDVVARGELVDIQGELGVRILRVYE